MAIKKLTEQEMLDILKKVLTKRQANKQADGTFYRWVTTAELSPLCGWNKSKVRYEFDKLVADKKIERYRMQHGAYIQYSFPAWEGCVRYGDYFKEVPKSI